MLVARNDLRIGLDRLSYDAAITKLEKVKSSKKEKEKDRNEAEDEYAKAKSR